MRPLYSLIRELIDIPSVTGQEAELTEFLEGTLGSRGFQVRLQEVATGRSNIFALSGPAARVVLCTHLDTVPPFFPSSEDEEYIYGRGACDAKGILATMIAAAERLRDAGARDIGLLFVVGEETDSIGARVADRLRPRSRYVIVGEPTGNRLASGHKGSFQFRVLARGTAGHSADAQPGSSAVDRLLDLLHRIRGASWGTSEVLGQATVNVGTISGGVAGNVVAAKAEAEVFVRVVGRAAEAREQLDRMVADDPLVSYQVLSANDAVRCETIPGFEVAPMSFGSDIPHLAAFGKPLLLGPGSIADAHGPGERVAKHELCEAVELYQRAVTRLLEMAA